MKGRDGLVLGIAIECESPAEIHDRSGPGSTSVAGPKSRDSSRGVIRGRERWVPGLNVTSKISVPPRTCVDPCPRNGSLWMESAESEA